MIKLVCYGVRETEVKYFEESRDADGNISLRFPTYLCFRDTNLGEFVL